MGQSLGTCLQAAAHLPAVIQRERASSWTDYENPYPALLLLELARQASDRQHRPTAAAEHRFLAVWSAAVHQQASAADRVKHNDKLRSFASLHPLCLFTTAPRLWRSNQSRAGEPVGGDCLRLLGGAVQDPWGRPVRRGLQASQPTCSGQQ